MGSHVRFPTMTARVDQSLEVGIGMRPERPSALQTRMNVMRWRVIAATALN